MAEERIAEEVICFWLEGADGNEYEFELVGIFDLEEGTYAALHPVGKDEGEVILMLLGMDDEGEPLMIPIEDDEEYEMAAGVFEALFNGEAEIEPIPDDIVDAVTAPYLEQDSPDSETGMSEDDYPDDYCYEDAEGRLFLYGENGQIVYLDENGELIL